MKSQTNLSFFLYCTLGFVVCAAFLVGCVSTGGRASGGGVQRVIKISAADTHFALEAQNTIERLGNVLVVSEDEYSELTLILDGRGGVASAQVLSKPKIVGILRKENKPATYQIGYTLIDNLGKTLTKGEVYGVGHEQEGFYPALNDENTAAQTAAQADALQQLNSQLAKELALHSFRSVVSSQLVAASQVAIPVAQGVTFNLGQRFYIPNMPNTRLKFMGFTQGINNQKQALLEVTEGPMPPLGTSVYLLATNQS